MKVEVLRSDGLAENRGTERDMEVPIREYVFYTMADLAIPTATATALTTAPDTRQRH